MWGIPIEPQTMTITYCPYCGTGNYIVAYWNTLGQIYCVKCGELI